MACFSKSSLISKTMSKINETIVGTMSLMLCSYFVFDICRDYFNREIVTDFTLDSDLSPTPAISICLPFSDEFNGKNIKIGHNVSEHQFTFNGKTCSKIIPE